MYTAAVYCKMYTATVYCKMYTAAVYSKLYTTVAVYCKMYTAAVYWNSIHCVQGPMNIIDMLAIIPFYLSLLLEGLEDFEIIGKAGKIVRLVKVTSTINDQR